MSFFKDFKEDLSQAVNELLPENAQEPEIAADSAIEAIEPEVTEDLAQDIPVILDDVIEEAASEDVSGLMEGIDLAAVEEVISEEAAKEFALEEPLEPAVEEPAAEEPVAEEPVAEEPVAEEPLADIPVADSFTEDKAEASDLSQFPTFNDEMEIENTINEEVNNKMSEMITNFDNEPATDENAIITEGMIINGDLASRGSLEVLGTINGNIDIKGKLDISGTINGNSKAAEIFADSAKITGEVVSLGSVKVGQSSVIVGNISATSAVIAGAVKGDIDVHGPVILDTSAIVMGDIKSKSVQINNGAVIEGHCSQCYAEVSPTSFFNDLK